MRPPREGVLALFAAVGLLAAQAALRPDPTRAGEAARAQRALVARDPMASRVLLATGLQPLLQRKLWWDFEEAVHQKRPLDAVRDLAALARSEPDNARVHSYLAQLLAIDLALLEKTPRERLGRILEGLGLLERALRRPALAADASLWKQRAELLRLQVLPEPALVRGYARRRRRSPLADAWEAYRRACALPQAPEAVLATRVGASVTGRMRAVELLLRGDGRGAAAVMAEAAGWMRGPDLPALDLERRLAGAWNALISAFAAGEPVRLEAALGRVAEAVAAVPPPSEFGGGSEEALLASVLPRTLSIAGRLAAASRAQEALSLLRRLHTVQRLLANRLGRYETLPATPVSDPAAWNRAVTAIAGVDDSLGRAARALLERRDHPR